MLALIGAALSVEAQTGAEHNAPPPRPKGPCDIYASAGDRCVAVHSTTRALYASYNGPLYQVLRQSATVGAASFAPNLAAETTPIENWLELEAGVTPFFTRNSTEWDAELLFNKPWTLTRKAEFMLGIGLDWVYLRQNGTTSNPIPGEVAGDFMFWPTGRHRFGCYLEPAYDYNFMAGHQQSIGMSAGLLIGVHRKHS
jgi:hypothetical protein